MPVTDTSCAPLGEVGACAAKFLNSIVTSVGNVDISVAVNGNPVRPVKLAVAIAPRAPLRDISAVHVEFLDSAIAKVNYVDEMIIFVNGDTTWTAEFTLITAGEAKL